MLFECFLERVNATFPSQYSPISKLKAVFFSLKTNKSCGVDEVNFNAIKYCFGELCGLSKYLLIHHCKVGYLQTY